MPGNLTWQQVAAPDLSTALQGIRGFGQDINQAAATASGALADYRQNMVNNNSNQLLASLNSYSDPKALAAALAPGGALANVDPTMVSAKALEAAGNRAGTLITNASNQQQLDENKAKFDRIQDEWGRWDNARGALNDLGAQAADGKVVDYATALKDHPELANVDPEAFGKLMSQFGTNATSANTLANTVEDRNAMTDAMGAFQAIGSTATNAEMARNARYNGGFDSKLSPRALSYLDTMLEQKYPGSVGPTPGAAATAPGAPGQAPATVGSQGYDTQFGSGRFGDSSFKPSQHTVQEVLNYGDNTLRPQTQAAGYGVLNGKTLGTSAMGMYQIEGSTLRDYMQRHHLDPSTTQFDAALQEKIGQELFDQNKNGNLQNTWASLPDATPGAYKNMTWDQIKPLIQKGEVGGQGANIDPTYISGVTNRATSALASMSQRQLGDDPLQIGSALIQAASDPSIAGEDDSAVVNRLISKGDGKGNGKGAFAGAAPRVIQEQLTKIEQATGMKPYQAGILLEHSRMGGLHAGDAIANKVAGWFDPTNHTPNLPGGVAINDDLVNKGIQTYKTPQVQDIISQGLAVNSAQRNLSQARDNYAAQAEALRQARIAAATQPGVRAQLPALESRVRGAETYLTSLLDAAAKDPKLNPKQAPLPTTPAPAPPQPVQVPTATSVLMAHSAGM